MTLIIILIISFAFFTHSLLGFGGGLISIPILSLFMPVQDVVAMVMIYQFSMGLLIFKTYKHTGWEHIKKLVPMTIIGALTGVFLLKFMEADVMRILLAAFIIIHLVKKYASFDLLGRLIDKGGAHLAGLLGGILNAMIGGGAPAFVMFLKEKASNSSEFRANIIAMLMISNIPRAIGTVGTGMMTWDIFITGMYAFPAFLMALYAGQKLHNKIPQAAFFIGVDLILFCAAISLTIKVIL